MATSTAQGDAGVFELNFRDERYMPFEGMGAISTWRLQLPASFRNFDYQSINDVIVNISYTALDSDIQRADVEQANAGLEGTLLHALNGVGLDRALSLRQEFSTSFQRMMASPAGTDETLTIDSRHFPLFVQGQPLAVGTAKLVLDVPAGQGLGTLAVSVNGTAVGPFAVDPALGNLQSVDITAAFGALLGDLQIRIDDPGDLAPGAPPRTFDPELLRDLVLHVNYKVG